MSSTIIKTVASIVAIVISAVLGFAGGIVLSDKSIDTICKADGNPIDLMLDGAKGTTTGDVTVYTTSNGNKVIVNREAAKQAIVFECVVD